MDTEPPQGEAGPAPQSVADLWTSLGVREILGYAAKAWMSRRVGRLALVPEDEDYTPKEGEGIVRLARRAVFGTTHRTTQLVLMALQERLQGGDVLFDLGTGSGVLAIAGLVLGAGRAVANDVLAEAVEVCRYNAEINGVSDRIEVVEGSAADLGGQADIVVSNIGASVFVPMAAHLAALARRDVILSGFEIDRADEMCAAMQAAGLRLWRQDQDGDFVAQIWTRT